jgi:hypothetical protein
VPGFFPIPTDAGNDSEVFERAPENQNAMMPSDPAPGSSQPPDPGAPELPLPERPIAPAEPVAAPLDG